MKLRDHKGMIERVDKDGTRHHYHLFFYNVPNPPFGPFWRIEHWQRLSDKRLPAKVRKALPKPPSPPVLPPLDDLSPPQRFVAERRFEQQMQQHQKQLQAIEDARWAHVSDTDDDPETGGPLIEEAARAAFARIGAA